MENFSLFKIKRLCRQTFRGDIFRFSAVFFFFFLIFFFYSAAVSRANLRIVLYGYITFVRLIFLGQKLHDKAGRGNMNIALIFPVLHQCMLIINENKISKYPPKKGYCQKRQFLFFCFFNPFSHLPSLFYFTCINVVYGYGKISN